MIIGHLQPNKDIIAPWRRTIKKYKLDKDEKIIQKENNIEIGFATYGWGLYVESRLDGGKGNMIKTNKRLIYIRKIDPYSKSRSWPYTRIAGIKQSSAKDLLEKGIKEYFEFYFNEIRGYIEYNYKFFKWFNGIAFYIQSTDDEEDKHSKSFAHITFSKRYNIIDDPLILNKELSKLDIKELRKEYNEYNRSH